jgi:hypothetical protein
MVSDCPDSVPHTANDFHRNCTQLTEAGILRWQLCVICPQCLETGCSSNCIVGLASACEMEVLCSHGQRSSTCSFYDRQTCVLSLLCAQNFRFTLCTVVFVWMVDTILKDWIMQRIRSTDAGNFILSSADIMWTLLPFAAVGSCLDTWNRGLVLKEADTFVFKRLTNFFHHLYMIFSISCYLPHVFVEISLQSHIFDLPM